MSGVRNVGPRLASGVSAQPYDPYPKPPGPPLRKVHSNPNMRYQYPAIPHYKPSQTNGPLVPGDLGLTEFELQQAIEATIGWYSGHSIGSNPS
jgi:hypothetical protein